MLCDGGCGKTRPAGGTPTCPDCTLERKRLAAIDRVSPAPASGNGADPAVLGRDDAIRAALRQRPMNIGELMAIVPRAAGQSDAELRQLVSTALRRLSIKKQIFDVGELWKLA